MKSPKKTSLLTKSPFLPLTDTIHYTFKKNFSLKSEQYRDLFIKSPFLFCIFVIQISFVLSFRY